MLDFADENLLNDFYNRYFKKYEDIANIIDESKDFNCISKISQKEISIKLNISPSLVSKCTRRLERSDKCIEKISSGVYRVNHTDLKKHGPYVKFLRYITAILKDESFLKLSCNESGSLLNMSRDEIIMASGYFGEFYKELRGIKWST